MNPQGLHAAPVQQALPNYYKAVTLTDLDGRNMSVHARNPDWRNVSVYSRHLDGRKVRLWP